MKKIPFLIIPSIIITLTYLIFQSSGPAWIGYHYDPDYPYLFNSLNIAKFKTPGHVDHPGTPLQIIGAGVLEMGNWQQGAPNLEEDVLTRPEWYLALFNQVLLILTFLTIFCTGWLTYKLTNNRWYGWLFQITPLLSETAVPDLNRISPEPLLFIFSMWFSYFLLRVFILHTEEPRTVVLLGILSGLSIATKINSLPWLIIPIIILSKVNKFKYLIVTMFTFWLFLLPVFRYWPKILGWLVALLIHSEKYAYGAETVFNLKQMIINFINMSIHEPWLLIMTITTIILSRKHRIIAGIAIFLIIFELWVTKHYALRYVMPALGMLGMIMIIIWDSIKNTRSRFLYLVLIGAVILVNLTKNVLSIKVVSSNLIEAKTIDNIIKRNFSDHIVVQYYGASSPEAALEFGNLYANNNYGQIIFSKYPQFYYFLLGSNSLIHKNSIIPFPNYPNILFRGVPLEGVYSKFKPNFALSEVFIGKAEALYLIR